MNISEKLLNLRKAHNLTQEQLAEQLNVSRQSISKWESGQCIPDADKLKLLSDIFNVSIDFLLKPSELDALTLKAESLENQQRNLENTIRKKEKTKNIILHMVVSFCHWEREILEKKFPYLRMKNMEMRFSNALIFV